MLPIIFATRPPSEPSRIMKMLEEAGCACTPEQAQQLCQLCGPLPQNDGELFAKLTDFVQVDWHTAPLTPYQVLKGLAAEMTAAPKDQQMAVHRKMLMATNGMSQHPDWWDWPCLCDSCMSDS